MKAVNTMICFMLAFLLAAAAVGAEEVESVILTTDSNYPDTMVASVAGDYIGAPVLITSKGQLTSETEDELSSLAPTNVYIIGGPYVVSEAVEEGLEETYNVVRLWGMTRYGTAVEVAEYFWETSSQALLVWDVMQRPESGNAELISEAKDLAMQHDMPALLIRKNDIPDDVVDALVNLSVESVILVGNVGSDVEATLSELGIEISDHIKGADVNETRRLVRQRIKTRVRLLLHRPLVVVAVGNWSDTIRAPYMPNGTSRHISSEDQIDDLISEINDMDYNRILVVGKPELAAVIHDRLTDAGINATLVSGRPAAVAARVMRHELARIRERADAIRERLLAMHQRMIEAWINKSDSIISKAERMLQSARISDETKDRIIDELRDISQAMQEQYNDGNYSMAWVQYKKMESRTDRIAWNYRDRLVTAYRQLVDRETRLETSLQRIEEARRLMAAS